MKIYSHGLRGSDIVDLAERVGMRAAVVPIAHPKLRAKGWEVASGGGTGTRWKNTGQWGASSSAAATWDDHGRWFALIFSIDPKALIVAAARYDGAEEFHTKTKGAYR